MNKKTISKYLTNLTESAHAVNKSRGIWNSSKTFRPRLLSRKMLRSFKPYLDLLISEPWFRLPVGLMCLITAFQGFCVALLSWSKSYLNFGQPPISSMKPNQTCIISYEYSLAQTHPIQFHVFYQWILFLRSNPDLEPTEASIMCSGKCWKSALFSEHVWQL